MTNLTSSNPLAGAGSLDDFQPKPRVVQTQIETELTRLERSLTRQSAQDRGFVIDNLSTLVKAKRSTPSKASKSHTLRLYVQDINRFQSWCNDNNYSQARGLEILLDSVLKS